jgi:hypothetical protein
MEGAEGRKFEGIRPATFHNNSTSDKVALSFAIKSKEV